MLPEPLRSDHEIAEAANRRAAGDRLVALSASGLNGLLEEIEAFVRRFVVLTDAQSTVIALWIAHTHTVDAAETTPYLVVTSPTKRSGKSRLLEVLALLVRTPLRAAGASEAALFRSIGGEEPPTLLMDEVDAIFGPKAREHEDIRALLNAGYARGTPVLRCVGEGSKMRVEKFEVFCPKALAGIGQLPDTITDRSLPIRLKRRARSEHVERLRARQVRFEATPLREQLESWGAEQVGGLADARPLMPDELDDRAQDACEPLLAIADLAGEDWPSSARRALIALRAEQAEAEDDTISVRLLADVWAAFEREPTARLSTERLCELLAEDEEAPWAEFRGKPITARVLARLLRPFGVRSGTVRLSDDTTAKGYKREQFEDAWKRYPPENGFQNVTSVTTASLSQKQAIFDPSQDTDVTDTKSAANPHEQTVVTDVTDRDAGRGQEREDGRPSIGDDGYAERLRGAFENEHMTKLEGRQALMAHKLVRLAEKGADAGGVRLREQ